MSFTMGYCPFFVSSPFSEGVGHSCGGFSSILSSYIAGKPRGSSFRGSRHGLASSRDGSRRFRRLLCLSLLWLILLILLSPSSPFPPPSFSTLFLLLPTAPRQRGTVLNSWGPRQQQNHQGGSGGGGGGLRTSSNADHHDPAETLSTLTSELQGSPLFVFSRRGVQTPGQYQGYGRIGMFRDHPYIVIDKNVNHYAFSHQPLASSLEKPVLPLFSSLRRFCGGELLMKTLDYLYSAIVSVRVQLPGVVYSAAIERDKFKLSCTQASFCHRYLHWVDLFAKKIPRASVTAPPLYTVDTKSFPRPSWVSTKQQSSHGGASETKGREQQQQGGEQQGGQGYQGQKGGGGGGGGGEKTSPPLGFAETKGSRGKGEQKKEKAEDDKKRGSRPDTSSSSSEEKKKKKRKLKGSDKAPAAVLTFDVVRGSDGLRLQAKLAVYRHGIVRLRMKERRANQGEEKKSVDSLARNEPQNLQAPVFRLDERFERYDGFTADILQLEEDPQTGANSEEVKISYAGNATVVDFVAEPPTTRSTAFTDEFVSEFFRKKAPSVKDKKPGEEGSVAVGLTQKDETKRRASQGRRTTNPPSSSRAQDETDFRNVPSGKDHCRSMHTEGEGTGGGGGGGDSSMKGGDEDSKTCRQPGGKSTLSSSSSAREKHTQNLCPEASAFLASAPDGMNVRAVLQHTPFALRVYVQNKLVQEVNEKQLLNWEAFLPVHVKAREAAEAEGRQQIEERHRRDLPPDVPASLSKQSSSVPPDKADAEATKVAQLASSAGVDLTEKLKGLRGIEWKVGEPLGDDFDEEREVMNDIIMPLLHAGEIRDAVDLFRYGAMEEAFDRFLDSKPFGPTAIGVDVTFWGATQVYGLFEHAAPFPLKSYTEPYRLYNLDVFNYELDSPFSTYGSMPFLMALHAPISRHTSGRHTGGLGRYGGTRRFSSFGSMKEPTGGGGREEANRGASRGVRDEDLLSLHSAVPKRRRGSFSSSLSADAGESTHNRDESDPRAKPALVTGFMILNPTEIWMKLRYDEGGEDLPESYAGLNEEEDEPEDPITRRHKRARHRMYESFASRDSLHWDLFQPTAAKWRSKYEALRTWWVAEGGVFDVIMFLGPTPQDVHRQYHIATGLPSMPPMFALTKHQCRWNYNDQADVLAVDRGFDENNIPYDVIWIDIEHTKEKRYFTWDSKTFPDPSKMIEDITKKNRKIVTIVDPHIKAAQDYYVYKEALEHDLLVRNPLGGVFHGHCWPGDSVYADFINPKVRRWWKDLFSYERYKHSTPDLWIWNDMNEPSVFSGPELSMPKDLLHMEGLLEHREIHNLYGHYHHRSTYEGLVLRGKGEQRPFLLTRSTFIGSHRFGFVWTGDNRAEWNHMAASVPMILSAAACGMSAVGADVDGFFADTPEELHIRWQQLGIFYPFYRSHAHMDTKRREPWLFSRRSIDIVRAAAELRYKLLPFWYTLFAEYAATGDPVVRPLWWLDPLSGRMQQEQQAFLVGSELSVHPILHPMEDIAQQEGTELTLGLVRDGGNVWFDLFSGLPFFISSSNLTDGEAQVRYRLTLENIPVFVRGGTILLTKERIKRTSAHMFLSPYTLHIYPSAPHPGGPEFYTAEGGGPAYGRLYVDDYNSFKYLHGDFLYEGFAYKQEEEEKEEKGAEQETSSSSTPLKAKTWTLRSTALPLELLDSAHDEPLQGRYRNFPHSEIERIVLWSVPSRPVRVFVKRRRGGTAEGRGAGGGEEEEEEADSDTSRKIEEVVEEEAEEKDKKKKSRKGDPVEPNLNVENRPEEDLLFSVEEIEGSQHTTQRSLLGDKVFYRVDVKLPKIHVGTHDWSVHFTF